MKITLNDPILVAVSPPQYGEDPAGRWWGFFQFPDLWRCNDGALYLAVNVGADSEAGRHEPTQFFRSDDGGRTWIEAAAVVGPGEKDLLAKPLAVWWAIRHDFSCANTSVVIAGPDRFLVAYSDFRHRDAAGRRCKAIRVREVRISEIKNRE